ncbi:MAG: hypothetical protein IT446_06500 [Phycisphaerales bacterium]|nr:hypothetical protein [Phycisphaerales bacterium]
MNTQTESTKLRLTRIDAMIIEHRLSAGSIAEVISETWGEQHAAAAEEAEAMLLKLVIPLMKRGGELDLYTRLEAWCIAECVEGSTWDGGGGFNRRERDRMYRQVDSLRDRLNANTQYVELLGREVLEPMGCEPEGYSPFALPMP